MYHTIRLLSSLLFASLLLHCGAFPFLEDSVQRPLDGPGPKIATASSRQAYAILCIF